MTRIALVTCAELPDLDEDDRLVLEALRARGVDAVPMVWDDPGVDWLGFDLAVLRSTWDYPPRRDEFLAWADSVPAVLNPAEIIRWNTDKRYLRDLESAGVPVVRTQWLEPGAPVHLPGEGGHPWNRLASGGEYVIKPAVGAGSVDTGRYRVNDKSHLALAREHVARLHDRNATVMVQPYLSTVDAFGETAMLFFGGEFSHAIRKGPMLDGPDRGVAGLYRRERITSRTPSELEHKVAELVLAAVPTARELLYARVDLLPGADGSPMLLELELTEPSLFFAHGHHAPERFADAVMRWIPSSRQAT
ncbi:hypothetical protein EF847_12290 [Actinobacteria bacterium YIM 96077]|uniref:ATP-grasp domain-containing protein n=1 Tax=Phytoactinopolyspora halophila TaxID=1981511 RepID=A0A329R098_9ACTN|nr:hypothetical protein [Phytoactinopolyspora halophila]AYY13356.1 hypothetical protein EF847_12290 [Actinobacteria bacterium YIM 96077]RAW17409.1 hypothetical protein DPM12_05145 [Phytoactinopolyspora halophila]